MPDPFRGSARGAGATHGCPLAPQLAGEERKASAPIRAKSCDEDAETQLRGVSLVSSEAEMVEIMEATLRNLETMGPLCPNSTMWELQPSSPN